MPQKRFKYKAEFEFILRQTVPKTLSTVTQTDIRVKSYCRLNLLRTSVLNFELLNLTSELKVIVFLICLVLLFWISSVSIYYGSQSDMRAKSYSHLNLLRASDLNFERLDLLRDSTGHPCIKLLSFQFAQSF